MLVDSLRKLPATGPDGFEGLTVKLLSAITGRRFHLAKSGTQSGRDISARDPGSNVTAVECKRFGENTGLLESALLGKMAEAKTSILDLDLWVLVTSRTVPSQTIEKLHHYATQQGFEFQSISAGDGKPSSLEAVCAASPKIVLDHLKSRVSRYEKRKLKKQFKEISANSEFVDSIQRIKDWFLSPQLGYDNWRVGCNELFIKSLYSEEESRGSYGQILNVEDPGVQLIDRLTAWKALDEWYEKWNENHNMFIMLGEEGDGKTWSVASWLRRKTKQTEGFPSVIFLASKKTESNDPLKQVSTTVSRMMRHISIDKWNQRLTRWITDTQEKNARIILVLDGINERFGVKWWRDFLDNLKVQEFRSSVAVLVTCRTGFWKKHFEALRTIHSVTYELPPYDDKELAAALEYHGLVLSDISADLQYLIRKPRYFDLMIKYRNRVSESGDVTVPRLIYEDWRDRLERKSNLSDFDDYKFQDLLKKLASECKRGMSSVTERKLDVLLPSYIEKRPIIEELRTGGIIGDDNRVDEQRLIYGFGLLLVDQIREEIQRNDTELAEIISSWLEPHAEMDVKASICEFAALHALSLPDISQDIRVALLLAWVNSHNPDSHIENDLGAYLPIDPQSYFNLAEVVWSDTDDNPWAQDILMHAMLRWRYTPNVADYFPSIFERWLGFVHVQGIEYLRGTEGENADKVHSDINERLGFELKCGVFEFGDRDLIAIDDDGLLRLGRVALNVISHTSRLPHIHAIATGCLSEAIMGEPDKYELFKWVVMSSEDSLWDKMNAEISQLLSVGNKTAQQAAYRLLSIEGSTEARRFQETLPDDLIPPNPFVEHHRKDPCRSIFAWSQDELETCIKRDDLEPHLIARKLQPFCINPEVDIPDHIKDQLGALLISLPKDRIWASVALTIEEHNLEQFEPCLCAFVPLSMAKFVRNMGQNAYQREGVALRQLAFRLTEHYLVFYETEFDAIFKARNELLKRTSDWTREDELSESSLFRIVLYNQSSEEQFSHLLRRPENAHDLVQYAPAFKPISDWDLVLGVLQDQDDVNALRRALWFISCYPEQIPDRLTKETLLAFINHPDSMVRAYVLKIIYLKNNKSAITRIIRGPWAWDMSHNDLENHWGSLLLSEYGTSLSYPELRSRIHPIYLGFAVQTRGLIEEEVKQYAEDIHFTWQQVGSDLPDLPPDMPHIEIEVDRSKPLAPNYYKIPNSVFSKSISFIARNSIWGGMDSGGHSDLKNLFGSKFDDKQIDKLYDILERTIDEQKKAGNHWFGRRFDTIALKEVVDQRPDLLHKWLDEVYSNSHRGRRLLKLGRSFYEALCSVFLQKSADEGIRLYWELKNHTSLNIIDYQSEIGVLDIELFKATKADSIESAWAQRLEQCKSDRELLEVAITAQMGNGKEWLWDFTQEELRSNSPFSRSRAIRILGFIDSDEAGLVLDSLRNEVPDTWRRELVIKSLRDWRENGWAKHWFRAFLREEDPILAWRSFRLFLVCVTGMFWIWRKYVIDEFEDSHQLTKCLSFLSDNLDTIKNRIKKNEKDLNENYLAQKVLKGQVWPWMN